MAKEKKRGFFSWLGFGQKEQSESTAEQAEITQNAESQTAEQQEKVAAEAEAHALHSPADEQNSAPQDVQSGHKDDELPVVAEKTGQSPATQADGHQVSDSLLSSGVEHSPRQTEPAGVATPAAEVSVDAEPLNNEADQAEIEQQVAIIETLMDEPVPGAIQQDVKNQVEQEIGGEDSSLSPGVTGTHLAAEAPEEEALSQPLADQALAEAAGEQHGRHKVGQLEDVAHRAPQVEEIPGVIDQALAEEAAGEQHGLNEAVQIEEVIVSPPAVATVEVQEKPSKEGFFAKLKRSLIKTRQNLGSGFMGLFRGKKIDDELFEELEEQLLIADVGVETTRKIIDRLTEVASRQQLRDAEALYALLKEEMSQILAKVNAPLNIEGKKPFVILMVGVNGVGKTTTIGKLARQFELEGKSVMLAAGDTFRAAAVEQLQVWGERNNIPVIAQHTGADSASVIFDAIQAAKARNVDVLIADTAGRLQNKAHLMEELKKIVRVMKKLDEDAPHEVMLTLDASTGQNAISQAKLFHEAVGLTGITLTKLDGTAKGGVIFSVADQFGIPIRYIGVGEQLADLRPFHSDDFIEALFARED